MRKTLPAFLAAILLSGAQAPQETASDLARQIQAIFKEHCIDGHGPPIGASWVRPGPPPNCEDCCASLTQRAHDEALLMHARRFGRVSTAEEVMSQVGAAETPRAIG
jgi:hypothetical protein